MPRKSVPKAPRADSLTRLDGYKIWCGLSKAQRAVIGEAAIDYIVSRAIVGTLSGAGPSQSRSGIVARASAAAATLAISSLNRSVANALDPDVMRLLPIPASIGAVCRKCGCTEGDACGFGCYWIEDDLCSACAKPKLKRRLR